MGRSPYRESLGTSVNEPSGSVLVTRTPSHFDGWSPAQEERVAATASASFRSPTEVRRLFKMLGSRTENHAPNQSGMPMLRRCTRPFLSPGEQPRAVPCMHYRAGPRPSETILIALRGAVCALRRVAVIPFLPTPLHLL